MKSLSEFLNFNFKIFAGGGKVVQGRSRAMLRSGGGDSAVPLIMDDSSATSASQVRSLSNWNL